MHVQKSLTHQDSGVVFPLMLRVYFGMDKVSLTGHAAVISLISKSHPYWHVRSIVERYLQISALSLSYYTYEPQSVSESRRVWEISSQEFLNDSHVEHILLGTPRDQELAIHSDVRLASGERKHLLMVDMSTSSRAHLEKLRVFLGDNFFEQIVWFASGRSFHGYGETLLSEGEWVRFMGLLLLANRPKLEPTVDPRWIGHRLLAGYSALRWTRTIWSHRLALSKQGKAAAPLLRSLRARSRFGVDWSRRV